MNRGKHGIARKGIFTLSTLSLSCLLAFNAQAAIDCTNISEWESSKVYNGGDKVQQNKTAYKANYWTQNNSPATNSGQYSNWLTLDTCIDTLPPVDNIAPTVSITSPTATTEITTGDSITISANAADSDGTITNVKFSVDGKIIGTDTQAPYSLTWQATAGEHALTAIAYDNDDAISNKAMVIITVNDSAPENQAPTISITTSATIVELGDVITITADAMDSDGQEIGRAHV